MFQILSGEQIGVIHDNTLKILEETGVQILHKEAINMLKDAGAKTDGDSVVRIPAKMVEEALRKCPESFIIYDRTGEPFMNLDGRQTYFGTSSDDLFIKDHKTNETRPFLIEDIETIAKVVDALPNMHFLDCASVLPKEDPQIADRLTFMRSFEHTKKPLCFLANYKESCRDIIKFCSWYAGGKENLRSKPFIFHYSEPISPLLHPEAGVEKILICADSHVPLIYMPYVLMGGTAPVTIAGALVQCNAEILSGLVIQQFRSPGAPFIYGAMPSPFDMKTTIGPYGAPELHLAIAAAREIARHYKIPFFGTAGTSDSKHHDYQAIMEFVMSCMLTGFTGPELAHDVGFLDHSNIISPEMIVLTNEIIDMIRPLTYGIAVTEETLAIDLINKVAQKTRHYVQEEHTLKHFKGFWYPELLDRSMEGETPELSVKVKKKLESILKEHKTTPLEKDVIAHMERMLLE